jgi:hypothetical protein
MISAPIPGANCCAKASSLPRLPRRALLDSSTGTSEDETGRGQNEGRMAV